MRYLVEASGSGESPFTVELDTPLTGVQGELFVHGGRIYIVRSVEPGRGDFAGIVKADGQVHPLVLVGRVVTGASAARWLGERVWGGPGTEPDHRSELIHWHLWAVWLQLDGLGYVCFRLTTEEVELYLGDPYPGSESERVGALDAPAPLAALVGATITRVKLLYATLDPRPPRWWRPAKTYFENGYVLETTKGTVAIADAGDEYAIGEWPDERRWRELGVEFSKDIQPTSPQGA